MPLALRLEFSFGSVIPFDMLSSNSIALDGAVQGPKLDPANRRYSFDHHDGCSRFATLATCQQVALALEMGLAVDENTVVLTNDIDADTVVSVWLLRNPEMVNRWDVVELVEEVGMMDAHFMGEIHPMHRALTPARGAGAPAQSLQMLEEMLTLLDRRFAGDFQPVVGPSPAIEGAGAIGWSPTPGWSEEFPLIKGKNEEFNEVYGVGHTGGIAWQPAADGTWLYTIAKRSDFVQLAVGPGHINRAKDPSDYRNDTLLGVLGMNELLVNPEQDPSTSWGGGSCIGGSPRNKNPNGGGDLGSRLTPKEVIRIVQAFAKG